MGLGKDKDREQMSDSGFKSNPYDFLDELTHDPEEEVVVAMLNEHLSLAVKSFLEGINFRYMSGELNSENDICVISLEKGTFKFIDHLREEVTLEVPGDWVEFENVIESYVNNNPIIKSEGADVKEEMAEWDSPTEEKTMLDKSLEAVKEHIKKLQKRFDISVDEAMDLAKDYQREAYHINNRTTYTAKGDAEVQLVSGLFNNYDDLVKKMNWEDKFREKYGRECVHYMRDHDHEGVEKKLLSEMGFEYMLDDVVVDDNSYWNNRVIEVKYQGQEDLPELDKSAIEEVAKEIEEERNQGGIPDPNVPNLARGMDREIDENLKVIKSFDEETNVVIFGSDIDGDQDLQLNDDYYSIPTKIGNRLENLETEGLVSIVSLEEFQTKRQELEFNGNSYFFDEEFIILPNFRGNIAVCGKDNGESIVDIDIDDFLHRTYTEGEFKLVIPQTEYFITTFRTLDEKINNM